MPRALFAAVYIFLGGAVALPLLGRVTAFDMVRGLLGAVLLTAAGLKLHELSLGARSRIALCSSFRRAA